MVRSSRDSLTACSACSCSAPVAKAGQIRQEHVAVLLVRLGMDLEVGHVLHVDAHVLDPAPGHAGRVAAALVHQQPVVVAPLRHRQRRQTLQPGFLTSDPRPAVERRAGGGDGFRLQDIVHAEAHGPALLEDQADVSVLGILVLDHLAVLMLEDLLLDPPFGAVSRNIGPAIAAMPDEVGELPEHDLGAQRRLLDGIVSGQRVGGHVVPYHVTDRLAPSLNVHSRQLPILMWCLTNTLTNLRGLLAVGCVALPRVVHATGGRPPVAPTGHRALPTTKMPSHLRNRICETPHYAVKTLWHSRPCGDPTRP